MNTKVFKAFVIVIQFICIAINVPFVIDNPANIVNWVAIAICSVLLLDTIFTK